MTRSPTLTELRLGYNINPRLSSDALGFTILNPSLGSFCLIFLFSPISIITMRASSSRNAAGSTSAYESAAGQQRASLHRVAVVGAGFLGKCVSLPNYTNSPHNVLSKS